jgi:hypothetical protein
MSWERILQRKDFSNRPTFRTRIIRFRVRPESFCAMPRFRDLRGQEFGRLTAIKRVGKDAQKLSLWLFKCACGKRKTIRGTSVTSGRAKSCGCLHREIMPSVGKIHNTTHGRSRTPEWNIYFLAKRRCTNPKNRRFKDYGGRGILFRFKSFEQFFATLGP